MTAGSQLCNLKTLLSLSRLMSFLWFARVPCTCWTYNSVTVQWQNFRWLWWLFTV